MRVGGQNRCVRMQIARTAATNMNATRKDRVYSNSMMHDSTTVARLVFPGQWIFRVRNTITGFRGNARLIRNDLAERGRIGFI